MWLWIVMAFGGSVDLVAERGWLQIEQGDPSAAHEAAAQLLREGSDPLATVLYLEASGAMGLGVRAVAETRSMEAMLPWEQASAPLTEAVQGGDDGRVANLVAKLRGDFPNHPEILVALWDPKATKKMVRLRASVLRMDASDPVVAARLHRLRNLIKAPDSALTSDLSSKLELEVAGPSLRDVELHEQARLLAEKGWTVTDLRLRSSQEREVVERAHRMLHDSARYADAAAMWQALGASDPAAFARLASSLRLAGDAEGAAAALRSGWLAIAAPQPTDVAVADGARRTEWAVELLAERSVSRKANNPAGAWADAIAATVLGGVARGATVGPATAAGLASSYKGGDKAAAAVTLAAKGVDQTLHIEAATAIVASAATSLENAARGREVFESGFAEVWSQAATLLTDPEDALTYATLAALAGSMSSELAQRTAELQAKAGHKDAAFQAAAVARGLGASTDDLLGPNYTGLGDAMVVATAIGGEPPPPQAAPVVRKRLTRSGPAAPLKGAHVGSAAPKWSIDTGHGTLSNSALKGRVVVMTFFASDYAPCVEQLQASGSLTRRLRGQGIDVVHVGISRDANRGRFDDLYRVGQRWGELAWAPEVATTFGISREPTTWVIDRAGITRYYVDHRVSASELEEAIRMITVE